MRSLVILLCAAVVMVSLTEKNFLHAGENWLYWVGPQGTGAADEIDLPDQWNPQGGENSNLLWTAKIGTWSTPTSMSGRLYLLTAASSGEADKGREKLVCLDAKSGKTLWEKTLPGLPSDLSGGESGQTSVVCDVHSGHVFAYGSGGVLCCLNATTGALLWEQSFSEKFGFALQSSRSSSPLVLETSVIIGSIAAGKDESAGPCYRILAVDRKNGLPVWSMETTGLAGAKLASAPVLGVIEGELQMVCCLSDGTLRGFHPRTGQQLWSEPLASTGSATTPLIAGNRIYCGHSGRNPGSMATGAVLCLNPTRRDENSQSAVVWKKTGYSLGSSAPQLVDGRLYFATDDARLICLNPENGEQLGESVNVGTEMRAHLLFADGKLFVNDVHGKGGIFRPTPQGAQVLSRYQFPEGEECDSSPIAVNGRLYFSTTRAIYCVGKADLPLRPESPMNSLRETHVALNEKPASLHVVPVEMLLQPGTRQVFHARLYNSSGQYLSNPHPEDLSYRLEGPGEVNSTDGAYTIPSASTEQGVGRLSISFGDLKGEALLRIIPKLDWSFDFNDGRVPETWIGKTPQHTLVDGDLYETLHKKDALTGFLYLYVMGACPKAGLQYDLDDSTPEQRWTSFLKFLDLDQQAGRPRSIEEAKARFDAGLKLLVEERVLERFNWTEWKRQTGSGESAAAELRLSLTRGSRTISGHGVLASLPAGNSETAIPLWTGPSQLHDYTFQADVLRRSLNGKPPTVGIIIQRYPFRLGGEPLQLQPWSLVPLSATPVAGSQQPDVWQTVKLKAENKEGKTTLSGKFWPRGAAEPKEWLMVVEATEFFESGSPGFMSGSGGGAMFFDNVSVIANKE